MNKFTKNIGVAFITRVIVILSGIIAQRYVLVSFGSSINGLTSTISQIMIYVELLEAGLGTASLQALYKPLATGDLAGVSGIYNATARMYRNIGLVFVGIWAVISFAMPFTVDMEGEKLTYWLVCGIVLLSGVGHVLRYMFMGKWTVLIQADNRIYYMNIIDTVTTVLNCVVKVWMINEGFDIISVLSLNLVWSFARLILLRIYVKKNFGYLDPKIPPNYEATKKRKNVMVHQIVGLVTNHTDVLILTVFDSLKAVSVYSIYSYVYNNIQNIMTTTFSQAPAATFGRLYAAKDQRLNRYYRSYEVFFFTILHVVLVTALLMTTPFVRLYTSGVTDVNYIDEMLVILFVLVQFFNMVRIPSLIMVNAGGFFAETQTGAIIEATIGIGVSIPLFFVMGMKGLLIGKIVSLLYRSIDIIVYVYRHVLKMPLWEVGMILVDHVGIGLLAIFAYREFLQPQITSWTQWLMWSGITFLIVTGVYAVNLFVFYRSYIKDALQLIRHKRGA
ncbi:MAG: hypothetical protein E7637_05515 [Ruminococcaceae bacterium]|nr:hypothetical protein [Oscillospiraceae bacterium]